MEWPQVVLIVGIVLVIATWDCVRRIASARDLESRILARLAQVETNVTEQLDAADDELAKRFADHAEHVSTIKRGVDAYVQQTTAEINSLKSGLQIRSMRA